MDVAALILSVIALITSIVCLALMLAKNFFSTHKLEFVPATKDMSEPGQVGNNLFDAFRELGDPVDSDELEQLELLRQRKIK